ncbi:Methionyl-tRNA formyltransferase [hydrothermal vent metagenome]|uniref:methionyl-tRNA formyltransferase n=1 Tax=hydrothermal vent metagenome TaxID=652676 RepID=A0A1W1BSN1_9ZZZZ
MIKVIFMGTPEYAEEILKKLIEDSQIEVISVYTQPDKPVGRKKILTPPPVKELALKHKIKVYQPSLLRDSEAITSVLEQECDFIVVAAYGQILPKEILNHAPCINLHASILPRYRGASPIQQAILNGDTKTGVTAMLMDEGLDTGDIIKIEECAIDADEMVEELFIKLTNIAAALTLDVVKNFSSYKPIPQDDAKASYCKKITKADGLVEFDDAKSLYNRYRAFTPWPGVYLKSGLKLKKMKLLSTQGGFKKGEILEVGECAKIGCETGSVAICRVQPPSKKEMDIISYLNGKRLNLADTLA